MFNIPNEEENKKLKNILKLRETVEKDLEKKGISVQKKEQKQNTIYKPSSDLETINYLFTLHLKLQPIFIILWVQK